MALDRTVFTAWVDDDGSNTVGTPLTKAAIDTGILDPVDAEIVRLDADIAAGGGPAFALGATVASNALTIALLSKTAGTPSASDPVVLWFRNVTVGSGTPTTVSVEAATTLVIPDTALMGASNGVPFRLWVVAFNDGGTVRLGAMNCATATSLYPLGGWGIASSTAVGTGSDSAQVFYTGSAVTAKAYTVLGYVDYEAGLATAGTYGIAPTWIQPFLPDTPLPGVVLQQVFATHVTEASNSSSTFADTGLTATITPRSAANKVRIDLSQAGFRKATNATGLNLRLVRDGSTVKTIGNEVMNDGTSAQVFFGGVSYTYLDSPAAVSALVYKTTFASSANNASVQCQYGGVTTSAMLLQEIQG